MIKWRILNYLAAKKLKIKYAKFNHLDDMLSTWEINNKKINGGVNSMIKVLLIKILDIVEKKTYKFDKGCWTFARQFWVKSTL